MSALRQDAGYALRGLARNGGFAAVAILTIGVGIGANTTIFSWMRALLLNPLPGAADPGRVVVVESVAPNGDPLTTSFLDYRDFRDHLQSFEAIAAVTPIELTVGDDQHSQPFWGEMVAGSYFDVVGMKPAAGRFFAGAERGDEQNAHAVVVISHGFWKARYGLSPSAIGATLRINRTPFTVIGVAPEIFHGWQSGLNFDLWLPVTMSIWPGSRYSMSRCDSFSMDFLSSLALPPGRSARPIFSLKITSPQMSIFASRQ